MSTEPDDTTMEQALAERLAGQPTEELFAIQAAAAQARARWPDVTVAPRAFAELVARAWAERSTHPTLAARVGDLYLACACAAGDAEAARVLDAEVLRRVTPALRGMKRGQDFVDEALQQARERLLVGVPSSAQGRPRIAEYLGLGPLERWVRVFVVRLALQMIRGDDAPLADDEAAPGDATPAPDLEKEHLRARYGGWFKETLKRVFAELPDEDRQLVELMVQGQLSLSEIGQRLGLNKSTISRRMTAVRVRLFEGLQARAQEELRVAPGEYASLVQALRSQLDLSLGLTAPRAPES